MWSPSAPVVEAIAWVDTQTGLLQVGLRSAGALPGPACYAQDGHEPTVTDANLVLGRIDARSFFGGRKKLHADLARQAIEEKVARPLGMNLLKAAKGIVEIVDSHMADLVRRITVEQGYHPADFLIYAYGGGGPLHVGSYARDMVSPKFWSRPTRRFSLALALPVVTFSASTRDRTP